MSSAAEECARAFDFEMPPRPYPGLRPFAEHEWPIFFGRERTIDAVMARLVHERLLVIHGDSGCGKSSLIRAGVQPRLKQQIARGGACWVTCAATPGDSPLANLATALAARDSQDTPANTHEIHRILNRGRPGAQALAHLLCHGNNDHICILLDQFEELFAHVRHHGRQQASILIELLIGVHRLQETRLRVILTMRSEFLGACAQFEGFAQVVNDTQYLLPRMGRDDLLRAIQGPATLYDGEVAPELAEHLINDAHGSQDQLPLIQHALMMLQRNASGDSQGKWRLRETDYPASGGLAKLISDHADHIADSVESVSPRGKGIVEETFRALTEINADHQAIRRPQTVQQLVAVSGADRDTLERVLSAFRAEGVSFLRPYGAAKLTDEQIIDISHEAVIRCWRRIDDPKQGWLAREFDDGLIWSSLRVQCRNFAEDPKNVLSPATTEERQKWLATRNEAWAQRYEGGWARVQSLIAASVVAQEQQRRVEENARRVKGLRRMLLGMSVLSLVFLALVFWVLILSRKLDVKAKELELQAKKLKLELAISSANADKADAARQEFQDSFDAIRQAASGTPQSAAIDASIQRADLAAAKLNEISQVANSPSPRVYVQIAEEPQRASARALEAVIEATTVNDAPVIVPRIQLVAEPPPYSLLRCFVAEECRRWGPQLVDLINAQLRAPRIRLQDFSGTYTGSTLRPLHFELYFSPGEIIPAQNLQLSSGAANEGTSTTPSQIDPGVASDPDPYQPDTPIELVEQLRRGVKEMSMGNHDDAERSIAEVVSKRPQYFSARYKLGQLYETLGQNEQAIEELSTASRINSAFSLGEPTIHNSLGVLYQRTGRPRDALEQLTVAASYQNFSKVSPLDREKTMNDLGDSYASLRRSCESSLHLDFSKTVSAPLINASLESIVGVWKLDEWLEGSRSKSNVVAGIMRIQPGTTANTYVGEFRFCAKVFSTDGSYLIEIFRIKFNDGEYRFSGSVKNGNGRWDDDTFSLKLTRFHLEGGSTSVRRVSPSLVQAEPLKTRFSRML